MTRQTSKRILRIAGLTLFFALLNGLTFMAVFAKSEGQLEDESVLIFTADHLGFLAFPTFKIIHFLATKTDLTNTHFILIAIGLTGILYTILIEGVIRLTQMNRSKREIRVAAKNGFK